VSQELFPIVLARYLCADDYVVSNHRGHGHYLSVTGDFDGLIAEVMGRTSGASRGYGGSQHLRNARFYSNGIQGGMTPIAVGLAQALKEDSTRNLCVCFIGDGTLGEGVVYEAFNLAAKWQVPVLFAIEDNGYAQSSSKRQTLAGSIAGRAAAFGIRYFEANIVDVPGLDKTCGAATHYIRGELRPAIVHVHNVGASCWRSVWPWASGSLMVRRCYSRSRMAHLPLRIASRDAGRTRASASVCPA